MERKTTGLFALVLLLLAACSEGGPVEPDAGEPGPEPAPGFVVQRFEVSGGYELELLGPQGMPFEGHVVSISKAEAADGLLRAELLGDGVVISTAETVGPHGGVSVAGGDLDL